LHLDYGRASQTPLFFAEIDAGMLVLGGKQRPWKQGAALGAGLMRKLSSGRNFRYQLGHQRSNRHEAGAMCVYQCEQVFARRVDKLDIGKIHYKSLVSIRSCFAPTPFHFRNPRAFEDAFQFQAYGSGVLLS